MGKKNGFKGKGASLKAASSKGLKKPDLAGGAGASAPPAAPDAAPAPPEEALPGGDGAAPVPPETALHGAIPFKGSSKKDEAGLSQWQPRKMILQDGREPSSLKLRLFQSEGLRSAQKKISALEEEILILRRGQ